MEAVNFFGIVQQLYNFFSGSTHRWAVLHTYLDGESPVPKRLSDTRWEAHANATSALLDGYDAIADALEHLHDDEHEKGHTRRVARDLKNKMEEFEFVFMLELWNDILKRFCQTSKSLQDPKVSLGTCSKLYISLTEYLTEYDNDSS